MGGLRWHAVRVGRLLRSTEGVGAESHRVTGWRRVAGSRSREVAESQAAAHRAGKQAGRWQRGANGAARFTRADTTCDETMVQAWRSRKQARRRQARRGGVARRWALRRTRRNCLASFDDEGACKVASSLPATAAPSLASYCLCNPPRFANSCVACMMQALILLEDEYEWTTLMDHLTKYEFIKL